MCPCRATPAPSTMYRSNKVVLRADGPLLLSTSVCRSHGKENCALYPNCNQGGASRDRAVAAANTCTHAQYVHSPEMISAHRNHIGAMSFQGWQKCALQQQENTSPTGNSRATEPPLTLAGIAIEQLIDKGLHAKELSRHGVPGQAKRQCVLPIMEGHSHDNTEQKHTTISCERRHDNTGQRTTISCERDHDRTTSDRLQSPASALPRRRYAPCIIIGAGPQARETGPIQIGSKQKKGARTDLGATVIS